MSYQVLARKWRPRVFGELVGQEHVVRALINALDSGRIHHAFLFTGTRGVGKTTIARIFAKSLNCEKGIGSQPCGVCSTCEEINAGRFVDLIEIDAASRTKVEDTREILDNVQYAPARGRYKVYLIDEVHMLSNSSFNALLKTLEEPPPHVKFLLATTDPQKLPVTVLSRCLQFSLKRLPEPLIEGHLAHILQQENIQAELSAVAAIAKAADGSMRDALSLLDQAIAYSGGELRAVDVQTMLGTLDRRQILPLLHALAANDGGALIDALRVVESSAPDFDDALAEVLQVLHDVALYQTVPSAQEDAVVLALADLMAPEDVQLYYQIGLLGRRDLAHAPTPRSGFEMTLLRMLAFRPVSTNDTPTASRQRPAMATAAAAPEAKPAASVVSSVVHATPVAPPAPVSPAVAPAPIPQPLAVVVAEAVAVAAPLPLPVVGTPEQDWAVMVPRLGLSGMALELVRNCSVSSYEAGKVILLLDPAYENLRTEMLIKRVEEALSKWYAQPTRVQIYLDQARSGATPAQAKARHDAEKLDEVTLLLEQDPTIIALKQTFNAHIQPGSIEALEP
jgi:DNA polymerase III subunit gamma/tau